jgi:undecaprenyl-diphosphatase
VARTLGTSIVAGLLFVTLAVLVATRTIDPFDDAVRDWFWPNAEWGEGQQLADRVATVLDPKLLAVIAIAIAAVLSLRSRSVTPLLVVVAVVCLAGGAEIAVKWLMPRIALDDSHARFAGSFPSGHMTAAVGFMGAVVCYIPRRWRWTGWLALLALSLLVGVALLRAGIHYFSDVVGGVLLSTCVLAAVVTLVRSFDRTRSQREPKDADRRRVTHRASGAL